MCDVTVVIPNYNGKEYLLGCLESLYTNTNIQIDTVVVDNGSVDGSVESASEVYPQVRYVMFEKNHGFCRAVNEGIQCANTPFVLLLNNDTQIKEGFVEALLHCIKKSEKIFSVEAKMLQFYEADKLDSAGTYYCALGWAFARGKDELISEGKYNKREQTFASCGGAAIYRKEVFDIIGLFDEVHFAYLEDIDIGYRARIYGYINMYEPKAEVLHVGSAASGSRHNEFKVRYSARNNIYLLYKNMPFIQIVFNLPFLIIGFGAKTIFFYRKGLGKTYVKALKEGVNMCRQATRIPFKSSNFVNYIKIQLELWISVIRYVL